MINITKLHIQWEENGKDIFRFASLRQVSCTRDQTCKDVLITFLRLLQDYLLLEDHNVDAPRHSASNPTATGVPLDDLFWPLGILTDGWEDCERFAMYMFSALGIAVIEKIRAIDNLDFKRSAGLSAESKRCRNIRHGTFGKLPSEIIGMVGKQTFTRVVVKVAKCIADYNCVWRDCSIRFFLHRLHGYQQYGPSVFAHTTPCQ